jgi:hypothetical protein
MANDNGLLVPKHATQGYIQVIFKGFGIPISGLERRNLLCLRTAVNRREIIRNGRSGGTNRAADFGSFPASPTPISTAWIAVGGEAVRSPLTFNKRKPVR